MRWNELLQRDLRLLGGLLLQGARKVSQRVPLGIHDLPVELPIELPERCEQVQHVEPMREQLLFELVPVSPRVCDRLLPIE